MENSAPSMNEPGLRGLYCLAVAAGAATVTDPLVESASNAGWFGPGNFTDRSTIDVLPLLLLSVVLAGTYAGWRARPALLSRSLAFARRLRDAMRSERRLGPKFVAAAFAVQLALLFAIETAEQIVVAGHPLGGTVWLGAPPAIALACHFATCLLVAAGLARVLHAATRAAVDFALRARETLQRLAAIASPALLPSRLAPIRSSADPLASRLGKRAPPFLRA